MERESKKDFGGQKMEILDLERDREKREKEEVVCCVMSAEVMKVAK